MIKGIRLVNKYYDTEIRTESRKRVFCHPRQVYIYCMHKVVPYSLEKLANSVNLQNHATALHAIKTIENECETNHRIYEQVMEVRKQMIEIYAEHGEKIVMTETEMELVGVWLNSKGYYLDFTAEGWQDERLCDHSFKDLIKLMLEYKTESK